MTAYGLTPEALDALLDAAAEDRLYRAREADLSYRAENPEPYLRYEPPNLVGTGLDWDPRPVRNHNGTYVYPGRRTLTGYPARPENCPDNFDTGEWLGNGAVLVCRGCGLDST